MMADYRCENLEVTIDKKGADRYAKVTYPIRYGRYTEIRTPDYIFEFNPAGQIKYIRGLTEQWPHPIEWLKRTDANDWVYYTTGAYNEVYSFLGEYYRPCLAYPSNSLWDFDPFTDASVGKAIGAWSDLRGSLNRALTNGIAGRIKARLSEIEAVTGSMLDNSSRILHKIIRSRISVLPPDARHADYDVIPVIIADGCLYQCDFCCLKTRRHFQTRSDEDILGQIKELKRFFGASLPNYNALFLGNHDALAAGREKICMAAEAAYSTFGLDDSLIRSPTLYLFGSVDSILRAGDSLFEAMNGLPFYSYLNIGLESVDGETLDRLKKPVAASKVKAAFEKVIAVNRCYHNLEVTANFIMGDDLSERHYRSMIELVHGSLNRFYGKGALYLSPLNGSRDKNRLLRTFIEIKNSSRLQTFVYLIQRL